MQIVIDIPEKIYKRILNDNWNTSLAGFMCCAIANGIPLPKGHGRLKDEYEILCTLNEKYLNFSTRRDLDMFADIVEEAPTIIEADKEGRR